MTAAMPMYAPSNAERDRPGAAPVQDRQADGEHYDPPDQKEVDYTEEPRGQGCPRRETG